MSHPVSLPTVYWIIDVIRSTANCQWQLAGGPCVLYSFLLLCILYRFIDIYFITLLFSKRTGSSLGIHRMEHWKNSTSKTLYIYIIGMIMKLQGISKREFYQKKSIVKSEIQIHLIYRCCSGGSKLPVIERSHRFPHTIEAKKIK